MRKLALLSLLLVFSMLAGCATNAMTGRSQLSLVPEATVIAKGSQMYLSMIDAYDKDGKVNHDPALNERVQKITNRLVEQAVLYRPDSKDWQWQISVLENEETNASCLPGGKMVIYTGLIDKIQPTDDELAEVMGHEISHALANHGAEKMSVQMIANIAVVTVAVLAAAADRNSNQYQRRNNQALVQNTSALAAAAFITLPNSRTAETEADKLGIELAAQAGYNPDAALSFWKKMMDNSGQTSRGDFLSTHPSPPNRIDALQALQEPMNKIYETKKLAYQNYVPSYQYVKATYGDPILSSSNVRVIDESASPTAPAPILDPGTALVFYSPKFEEFKEGKLELTCGGQCSFKFFLNQKDFRALYEKQDWRTLAQDIIKTDYKLDLSYFYLAAAAEGLGQKETALVYYAKALELSLADESACAKGKMITCNGIDVTALSQKEK